MTRLILFLALPATIAVAADPPDLPFDLTVSRALNIALSNSIILRTAQAQLDQASGRYTQSRSPLLPQLIVGARQNYQTVSLIGVGLDLPNNSGLLGPFGSMDARAILSQDVVNFAGVRAWQSSGFRREASRHLVDNARELVSLNVVVMYLEALRAKTKRDTVAEQMKLAEELLGLTRDRVRGGIAAELDANRALQQVNSLEQQRQEAEQNYIAAKLNLANLLQARITSAFEVSDDSAYGDGTVPDPDSAVRTALSSRADFRSAEASVKAAEFQIRSLRASRLPVVWVSLDNSQSANTPLHNRNTYKVQGGIEFPIFTGGRIRGEIDEAEGALRQSKAAFDQNRSQIETEVLTAISGVELALQQVETSSGNVKLSRQEVELSRSRFGQGIADNTEVVNAQDRLARADDARIRALYTLGLARVNLARGTGAAEKTYRK